MSDAIYFAPIRVPFVDQRTGIVSREWYLFLQALFNRTGGTIAPGMNDVLQSIDNGVDVATLQGAQNKVNDAVAVAPLPIIPPPSFDDVLAELRQTRELVASLITSVQAIQQGVVCQ